MVLLKKTTYKQLNAFIHLFEVILSTILKKNRDETDNLNLKSKNDALAK